MDCSQRKILGNTCFGRSRTPPLREIRKFQGKMRRRRHRSEQTLSYVCEAYGAEPPYKGIVRGTTHRSFPTEKGVLPNARTQVRLFNMRETLPNEICSLQGFMAVCVKFMTFWGLVFTFNKFSVLYYLWDKFSI